MGKHIIHEAERCLRCKNPRCREGCPIDTDIRGMIEKMLKGDIRKAGKDLFENNPLSLVCSLVCPHERQCEGNCILGVKGEPVKISEIENYISDYNLDTIECEPKVKKEGLVAIIGSGPAGITLAFYLSQRGYDITVFESHDKIGGVLRYGIPEYRLPKTILDRLEKKLYESGVKIRPNTAIGTLITVEDLFRDGYDAVFIGTGVWKPNRLKIKGESLANVHFAIDYLKNPDSYRLGEKICVIGAGNTAIDVARTVMRKAETKEVSIVYRKGYEDMSATEHEKNYAKIEGIRFDLFKKPLEFTREGMRYIATRKVTDKEGNISVQDIDGSEGFLECDSIIVAVGQGPRDRIVSSSENIDTNRWGLVVTDSFGNTTREGVFASGDVVTGARTVVEAVRCSKKVAYEIEEYLDKKYNKI